MLSEHEVIQVGVEGEEQVVPEFRKNLNFSELGDLIDSCDTAICVDSYLQHHCWSLHKRAIVIFGISDPEIFGHKENVNLLKDRKYLRPNQFDLYYANQHNPEAYVPPETVMEALREM